MSRWSRNRQLGYLLSFLLIIGLIGAGWFYYHEPQITCTDGVQNGTEAGVDCGGSCSQLCRNEALPLKIIWTRVLAISPGVYAVAARVENPNLEAGVRRLKYTLRLTDANNILVTYRSGVTFVNPAENFILFEGGINTLNGKPTQALLQIETPTWERVDTEGPNLIVGGKTFTNGLPARLETTVTNRSIYDLNKVEVTALLSDAAGNALSAGQTYIEDLGREATLTAFFAWPGRLPLAPTYIDVYPRVSIFNFK